MHLCDRDLAKVAPAQGVLEVVVPFLEHPLFGCFTRPAVDLCGAVVLVLIHCFGGPEVVARGEQGTGTAKNDHSAVVIFFGQREGLVEFNKKSAVLSVPGVGAVEEDSDDLAAVVLFILQELEIGHRQLSSLGRNCDRRRGRTPPY